ncbi:MAG: lamin tail domain-containing protein [Flavobacteriia bacterium]|nr:lamin tail domain-containing protein [Flavobacteriia bacterium]
MRFFFLFFLLIFSFYGINQVNEQYDDGEFLNNPTWLGDDTVFTIIDDAGNYMLRSNKLLPNSSYYLSTSSNLVQNTQWEFDLKLTFNTSGVNYVDVYLVADQSNLLSSTLNGYFVRIGTTNDDISFYKNENGSITELIDGIDATTSTSNNSLKIKVVCSSTYEWNLERDLTGMGDNYVSEGTITDNTFTSSEFFGLLIKHSTLSFIQKHFFDNLYIGSIITDVTPPSLVSLNLLSNTQIDLTFSENISSLSAENINNYTFNPVATLSSAILDAIDNKLVHLTFANPITSNTNYTLTSTNIQDVSGNSSSAESLNFIYLQTDIPQIGDVIINEFICDPSPVVALPDAEFVEIYNKSNKIFNLKNWKLGDNSSDGTITENLFYPGEYRVLCSSSNVSFFSNSLAVTSFPSLNNTDDNIVLKDSLGNILDIITYDITWYQDDSKDEGGYSIERKNPNAICGGINNWAASNDISGGTPGIINSIYNNTPDTELPTITSIQVLNNNQIQVFFSEIMDSLSLTTATQVVNPNLGINSITVSSFYPLSMIITFTSDIQAGQNYSIQLSQVADCSQNFTDVSGQFSISSGASIGDILINEFICDPSPVVGLPEVEFVEIYNKSNKTINLKNWKLGDNSTDGNISEATILPNEYKVLCSTTNVGLFANAIGVTSFPSLNNTGDDIVIKDSLGFIIDKITYDETWYQDESKAEGGYSIERKNPTTICTPTQNWSASVDPSGGTPGLQNSIFDTLPDNIKPNLSAYEVIAPNFIALTFNEKMDSLSLANSTLTVVPNIGIQALFLTESYPQNVLIEFSTAFANSQSYLLTLQNVADCSQNTTDIQIEFALPENAQIGDLIINEILFNPITGGSDFIELKNISNKIINLKTISIANFEDDTISNIKVITVFKNLKPNDFVVITADSNYVKTQFPFAVVGKFIQTSLPTLNDDSSSVYILKDSIIIDKVSYSDEWHFALLNDDEGKTLERINPLSKSDDKNNWHTASSTYNYGTPGMENSQLMMGENNGEVNLTSPTFSPDNDGFEDFLQINFSSLEPSMLANIKIYDERGLKVHDLVSNQYIGNEGTLIWNGLNSKNEKLSIGVYVLVFEAFNLEGKSFTKKIPFVLAGKE